MATHDPYASGSGSPLPTEGVRDSDGAHQAFDAVVFDMDGVVTQTAVVHALAWKRMFDEYLRYHASSREVPFREFTPEDYRTHVDGRPRFQGVAAFLRSRGIELPEGAPTDRPGTETVCGLGNAKNAEFGRIIARDGVEVYESTVALMLELRQRGVALGLATSSRNSAVVLEKSGTAHLFGAVVDGVVSERRGLRGKPEPDIFLQACADLGVAGARVVVVEDAVSGVQAGARGGFALVIGVARENNVRELRDNGADVVVTDLAEITVDEIGRRVRAKRTAAS
ncbi:MAG TPA: HAD-IA family hydrolase [Opitutaceae bacterium]|nr:HAD-IA family hydrolase [Opitutaceae bacterium]